MKTRKGFTLIEILIVVAIIGLLASTVLVGLAPAQRRGRDARRLADLKEVQNALELYYGSCGHYPGGTGCGSATQGKLDWTQLTSVLTGSNIGVNSVPNDPSAGKSYQYVTNAAGTSYLLAATLEDTSNPSLKAEATLTVPSDLTGYTGTCGTDIYCAVF